mgnify:CR=1 FL=1
MTDVWNELFHQCALVAFADEARHQGRWPDSESVRRRAYRLYERELRAESDLLPVPVVAVSRLL